MRKWVKQYQDDPAHAFPGLGQLKPEQAEIAQLKKEIRKLKAEGDIPKNATLSSTGHRNTSLKFICGRTEIQSFPGPLVQAQCYLVQL